MPTTRRSASAAAQRGGGKHQSTLSFNHRVTKPVSNHSAKSSAAAAKNLLSTPTKSSPLRKHVSTADVEVEDTKLEEEEEEEEKDEAEVGVVMEEEEEEEEEQKSEAELRAENISDRQIDQYWRALERERAARRVHQEDLSVSEKVLRYWDVSSQYGPCVGISRIKRWQRADKLGLNPPVEVLAVLVREEGKGTQGIDRAHIDDILNSTAVGAS